MVSEILAYNINWFADHFGIYRQTVSKRIKQAGIDPVVERGGVKLYTVPEVAKILLKSKSCQNWGNLDPSMLSPLERQQFWSAEKARIQSSLEEDKLKKSRGQLLEADDVEYNIARLLRTVREVLLIIPDVLEAEAGLNAKQRKVVENHIDLLLKNASQTVREGFKEKPTRNDEGKTASV